MQKSEKNKKTKTYLTQSWVKTAQHFLGCRMIFEGSCDTEDWSNDAETALHHTIKLDFKK